MTRLTNAEICMAAGEVLKQYHDELKALRAGLSDIQQSAFIDYQLANIPGALFLLGAAAGRDSLRRRLTPEQLAEFDAENNRP